MIEVLPTGNRWTWQLIGFCGRVLVYTDETFECDHTAASAAKTYRSAFWALADSIDHRMARCI